MATLGTAYIQISPSVKGIKGSIAQSMGGEAQAAGTSVGAKIGSFAKKAIIAAAVGTAVVAGVKSALSEGAALQQSYLGGLETLYSGAEEQARAYAREAYKMGISMNDYSEQAVSFGAALKSAYGGDTKKAVEAANTALLDMADNSAKMGTPLESIQQAYQGFAKGQYQLLDNLKLGYGGTKTEMERLLADAEKITGVKYDISNLGDVYDAIHVVQGELGLTGVAAEEASQTLSGSFEAMKAASKNFMGSLVLGEGVQESMNGLVETATTFLFDNLFPAIGTIMKSLPSAMVTLIKAGAPRMISAGSDLINGIITGVAQKAPALINKGPQMITKMGALIAKKGPELLAKGQALMAKLGAGIASKGPELLAKGGQMVVQIATGILRNIPQIISKTGELLTKLVSYISQNLPTFAKKGGEILKNLATGFIQNLPSIIAAAAKFGVTLIKNILKLTGTLIKSGGELIKGLAKGLGGSALGLVKAAAERVKSAFTGPIEKAKEIIRGIVDKIKGFFGFSVNKPHIPMPHFSVSPPGWKLGDLLKGSIPSLGISWYAKGGIATAPTVAGIGEAGNEAILPLNPFWKKMDEIAKGTGDITINVYGSPGMDVNELASAVERKLIQSQNRRRQAWAL
jgi:hypothetical protein